MGVAIISLLILNIGVSKNRAAVGEFRFCQRLEHFFYFWLGAIFYQLNQLTLISANFKPVPKDRGFMLYSQQSHCRSYAIIMQKNGDSRKMGQ